MQTFASTTKTDRSAGNKPARSAAELDAVLNHSVSTISPLTINRKAGCSCGGGCPSCRASTGNLKVSQPNDAAEIEADPSLGGFGGLPPDKRGWAGGH